MKKYPIPDEQEHLSLEEIRPGDLFGLINIVREGIPYQTFQHFSGQSPFTMAEWSAFLGLSERTLQRYKKDNRKFDQLQSERIIEITLLMKRGVEVFGDKDRFIEWMHSRIVALGRIRPIELLDNKFGIQMLNDELTAIEHGIFA